MQDKYLYTWPHAELHSFNGWTKSDIPGFIEKKMPENGRDLDIDSRWPGFFPSAICFVTTTDGNNNALEKVVGATIVNRFPYVVALSFCIERLSSRHYVRKSFMNILEKGGSVAIQYFEPGRCIDLLMNSINTVEDEQTEKRIAHTGLETDAAVTNPCPVFKDAYLVYEARLVTQRFDHEGKKIFEKPYIDYGSHRIYFLEIEAIQLRKDIAHGETQINWKSLPLWVAPPILKRKVNHSGDSVINAKYQKGYTSDYYFPSRNTVAFDYDLIQKNRAVKFLPTLPESQSEVDNDKARWPCFFPSSLGMITTWGIDGLPNVMPCGSTSVLIRSPLCIAICVSYAKINIRYAPRASLSSLSVRKKFVCGVPFSDELIVSAIRYAGNISIVEDPNKMLNAGLQYTEDGYGPVLGDLPISYRCSIVESIRLGTHFLFLGKVESILVRDDVSISNCLKWFPFPEIVNC